MEEEACKASDDWRGGLEGSKAPLQWSEEEEALWAACQGEPRELTMTKRLQAGACPGCLRERAREAREEEQSSPSRLACEARWENCSDDERS